MTAAQVLQIAAFSDGDVGGNPAGVVIDGRRLDEPTMRRIARDVSFSKTVFAVPDNDAWRVRYFPPESEVPFCGHATTALGAALARELGDGSFSLNLNSAKITVEGRKEGSLVAASLQSPGTRSAAANSALVDEALRLFDYTRQDIDDRIPPALAHAGANHLIIALASRERLSRMHYELDAGREFMHRIGVATISLLYAEVSKLFHSRNAFASGGLYEDPATGAAAAALAGYLRDIDWPPTGEIFITQGEDMGVRSRLRAELTSVLGSSIRVSGTARIMGNGRQNLSTPVGTFERSVLF